MFQAKKEDISAQIDKINELLESITVQLNNNVSIDHIQLHSGYKLLHDSINNLDGVKRIFQY